MKIKQITLDEETLPSSVVVEMTIDECAAIAAVFGSMNDWAHVKLTTPDGRRLDVRDVYAVLVDDLINRFWDNGTGELVADITLATLNDRV